MSELLKKHLNLNTFLIGIASAVFIFIAQIGIKKVDSNSVELAVVHTTQNAVLAQLEDIKRAIDSKVSKEEFRSEIKRLDVTDDAIKREIDIINNNSKKP